MTRGEQRATLFVVLVVLFFVFLAITGENVNNRVPQEHTNVHTIQSIRLDDDGEYHILAIGVDGSVETLYDLDNDGYDMNLRFGNVQKPTLNIHISDACCGEGNFVQVGPPEVILPYNYVIETFDD